MNARSPFPLPSTETGFRPKSHYAGAIPIKRSIAAARKAGVDVAGVDLLPDGTIRLLDARLAPDPAPGQPGTNPLDRLHDEAQG